MALMITPWATGALAGRNGEWYVPMNSAPPRPLVPHWCVESLLCIA